MSYNRTNYSEYKYYTTYVDPNFEKGSGGGGGGGDGCFTVVIILFLIIFIPTIILLIGDGNFGVGLLIIVGSVAITALVSAIVYFVSARRERRKAIAHKKEMDELSLPAQWVRDDLKKYHYFCRHCGTELFDNYDECPSCGFFKPIKKVPRSPEEDKVVEPPPPPKLVYRCKICGYETDSWDDCCDRCGNIGVPQKVYIDQV